MSMSMAAVHRQQKAGNRESCCSTQIYAESKYSELHNSPGQDTQAPVLGGCHQWESLALSVLQWSLACATTVVCPGSPGNP